MLGLLPFQGVVYLLNQYHRALPWAKSKLCPLALFAKAHQAVQVPSAADLFDVLSEARAKQGRICLPIFSARIFSMDFKILASLVICNCLEGNTMRNRGAYSTKERMPSDIEPPSTNQPGRLYLIGGVLPSRQKLGIGAISPAHPRFSRMYGVTNSTVFQTAFEQAIFYDR